MTIPIVTAGITKSSPCTNVSFSSLVSLRRGNMTLHAEHIGAVPSTYILLIPDDRSAHVLSSRGGSGHSGWR